MTASWLEIAENTAEVARIQLVRARNDMTGRRWAPWRLESIEIRDALVAIAVSRIGDNGEDQDKAALAALVRAIGLVLADRGLLRPLVVYLQKGDPAMRPLGHADGVTTADAAQDKLMEAWEDDQDWHRGRFVFFVNLPDGVLTPEMKGFSRATTRELPPDDDARRMAAVSKDPRWGNHGLWLAVSDWAAAFQKTHGRAAPDDDALRDLRNPIDRWVDPPPTPAAPPDLPVLVLASYSPHEPSPVIAGIAARPEDVLYYDATATADARGDWEKDVSSRLLSLRESLQQRRLTTLAVHGRCTPALAIRAGAAFHASTGLTLAVVQRSPGTQKDELWRLAQGREAQLVELRIERRAPAGPPTELQLRMSATRPVDGDADAWTASATPAVSPFILSIMPPQPGDDAINGPDHAWDIARSVRAALTNALASLPQRVPVRIFFSGPTALAVWLGAQLNAVGTVILMDWIKTAEQPRYVASFHFQPGA